MSTHKDRTAITRALPVETSEKYPELGGWFDALPGERLRIRVSSGHVQGRFSVLESIVSPDCATPVHTHIQDEVFQVLSGTLTFVVGDDVFDAKSGEIVVVAAGTAHAWKNRSGSEVHMTATFVPGGVEELFTKIAGLNPAEISELALEYGTKVVGTPLA